MKAQFTACLLTLAALLLVAVPAQADLTITPGSFSADAFDQQGGPATQAGLHPYDATTSFSVDLTPAHLVTGGIKDVHVELPPGFVGDPEATNKCSRAAISTMAARNDSLALCPADSQVGEADIGLKLFGRLGGLTAAIYNVEAAPGVLASFAFIIQTVPVYLTASVDSAGDYRLTVDSDSTSQALPIFRVTTTFWGTPNDPVHDAERRCGGQYPSASCPVDVPRKPFLTNPSNCTEPQDSTLAVNSWQLPDVFQHASYSAPAITGCDRLTFDPDAQIRPTSSVADAPTGLVTDLHLPQADDPDTALAPPPLRTVTAKLPEGMAINPGSANGLQACTDAQLGLKSAAPVACPLAATLGTATAATPVLTTPLTGTIYLRSQGSSDPESGEMFRIALVLENAARGLLIKLPGQVRADAATGRLTATFADNPQLPVEDVNLTMKSGPRAPLVTSRSCGGKAITTDLSSWGGQAVSRSTRADIGCTPDLGGFAPSLTAGTTTTTAGAFSPFTLGITKPDGDADVTGLSLVLPMGLLAQLRGNVGTQVGTVKAFAGPGTDPFMLPGQVYLEGRYGDAPFSFKVVVPAKAGPFDLGEVVVRQKIYVDPITAQVTVVSDPLPTIVKGVPVRLQRLDVDIDKAGFVINPTSCAAMVVAGTLSSAEGQTVPVTNRFQAGDCSSLALKPSLALTLSGKGQTTDGKHPAVSAVLSQLAGQANLKRVRVALPLSLALDPDNSQSDDLCSFVEGSKPDPTCPASSVVGKATAVSPILNEPLSGPVYFTKNERKDPKSGRSIKTTPKLVIPLTGENGVKLTLTGASTVVDDQLVTTFDNIPDAQVSSFKMDINGGKKGILVISDADICAASQIAGQEVDGQNNKDADADVYIQTPSCPLKVLSRKVGKRSVVVKVGGLGAGKVTVTGKGIKKTSKTIGKSTVVTVTAKRTKGKPGKLTVSFDPAGPAKARKTTK
jgi:hypothetical protein